MSETALSPREGSLRDGLEASGAAVAGTGATAAAVREAHEETGP